MEDHQWSVLDDPEVAEHVEYAARRVANRYEWIDFDDLHQIARIEVTRKADLLVCLDEDNDLTLGMLQFRLERDLTDYARVQASQRQRHTSYEKRVEGTETGALGSLASVQVRNDTKAYDRELVETLIPAVWDENYCYGIRVENAPDGDMPRASTNKATGNTLAAHIADIKSGWRNAPLTVEEKRVLLLVLGLDWTQQQAAYCLRIAQSTVSSRLYTGVGKVMAHLNGDLDLLYELCDERLEAAA